MRNLAPNLKKELDNIGFLWDPLALPHGITPLPHPSEAPILTKTVDSEIT
jgi:hypothetical protein